MPRIDQCDDGIDDELRFQVIVQKERLRHRARVGHAGGFDQHMVKALAALEQLPQHANQITAYGAADAAVAGLEYFFFGTDDQLMIHTDFTELVFNDRDAPAMVLGQDAIEQRGFTRAQKAGQYRHRYAFNVSHEDYLSARSAAQCE